MLTRNTALSRYLERAPAAVFVAFSITAAFVTYFCMYAFRKPFAAASYETSGLKEWFVGSQIVGYALSKFIGVKVCSEMPRARRAAALVVLVAAAELALVLFAVLPGKLKVAAIFLNGLPLGMVWGLVVWYLEGRRRSDILLAGLACSFIVASGVVKDVGRALMDAGVSESWMPAATGAVFLPLYLLSVWLLNHIPQPDAADVEARVEREPMDGRRRFAFVASYFFGLALLFATYLLLTAYRDYRDNFGVELFKELGFADESTIFTRTELLVAFGVLAILALLNLVRDNRLGLLGAYAVMLAGVALLGAGTLAFDAGLIAGDWWMVLIGLGAYLTYVPYNTVLFERLIASTRVVGTAVFAIYVADALGYVGSVGVLVASKQNDWTESAHLGFFRALTYTMSGAGLVMLLASLGYFFVKLRWLDAWRDRRQPTMLAELTTE